MNVPFTFIQYALWLREREWARDGHMGGCRGLSSWNLVNPYRVIFKYRPQVVEKDDRGTVGGGPGQRKYQQTNNGVSLFPLSSSTPSSSSPSSRPWYSSSTRPSSSPPHASYLSMSTLVLGVTTGGPLGSWSEETPHPVEKTPYESNVPKNEKEFVNTSG